MTCVSAHYFDDSAALVGMRSVAQLINKLHNGVHCGVVADGVLRALDIVVDSSGQTYAGDTCLRKVSSASEGAIAADNHDACEIVSYADILSLEDILPLSEFLAACGENFCTAALDYISNISGGELDHIIVEQTVIAAANADNSEALLDGSSCNCTHCGIHAGSVAAACKYADCLLHC